MKNTIFSVLVCAAVTCALPVCAQDEQTGLTLGAGVVVPANPYAGEDAKAVLLPLIQYRGEKVSAGTDGVALNIYSLNALDFDLLAKPRFSALHDPDADELEGISRDFTLDAGMRLRYKFNDNLDLSATLLQEVSGQHDGQEILLQATNNAQLGYVPLSFGAGVSWKSDKLGSYMFGVTPDEAKSGRPEYNLDSTLTPYLSVSSGFPLSERSSVTASIRAEFLGDEITDSPIVDDNKIFSGLLGLSFSF